LHKRLNMGKETKLLLHGALGCYSQFDAFRALFGSQAAFPEYEFPGYGKRVQENSFKSLEDLADDLCAYLDKNKFENITVFGHSMGGYIAAMVEKARPRSFKTIITLGTKWSWNEAFALQEIKKLDIEFLKDKAPWFIERMKSYHGTEELKSVFNYTAILMANLGKNPPLTSLARLRKELKMLIVRGEKDKMVTEEESLKMSQTHPGAKYSCIQNWKHPYEEVPVQELHSLFGAKESAG
jgi:pimeloyl-ACP methyl ester carboxylesterase